MSERERWADYATELLRERDELARRLEEVEEKLRIAREGLEFYTWYWPRMATQARDTLARVDAVEKPNA